MGENLFDDFRSLYGRDDFEFPPSIPHGSQIVTLNASGVTGSDQVRYANFNGRLNIMQNVLNRPLRDYMLPRVDPASTAMVNPTQTTTVSNTNAGVTLTVPRNTAMNSDGTIYSGPLSVDMVPTDATPRELPEEFQPSFIITIQPTGVRFNNPVPITFPNTDNLPAGSVTELFSLSERGGFESVGFGRVSSDGRTITTIAGGVRSASWHFMTVIEPRLEKIGPPDSGDGDNNDNDPDMCEGSLLCVASGALGEDHELPGFVSHGVPITMKMGYKNPPSLEFSPIQFRVVYVTRRVPIDPRNPGRTIAINPLPVPRMTVNTTIGGSTSPMTSFNTTDLLSRPDTPFGLVKHIETRGMGTGIHSIGLSVGLGASMNGGGSRTMKKSVDYPVISPDTEFGMGWRFEGLHKLYGMNGDPVSSTSRKIMLVYGNFKFLVFDRNEDGTYTSPQGDYSTLSFIPEPFGGYSRVAKDGTNYVFDRHGKLAGFLDRYNRRTTYNYDTSSGKLTEILYSNGSRTSFVYGSDGYIDTITDPMMRVTRFSHDSTGHLLQIIDSDNTTRTFDYGADHRLLSQVDKKQRAKNYGYDEMGNVVQVIRPDNTQVGLTSKVTKLTTQGGDSSMVMVDNDSRFSNFSDARGNVTKIETNAFGSSMKSIDPMGQTVSYTRDEDNNITQSTDKRGNDVTRAYDSMGNLTSFRDAHFRQYSYGYMSNPADNFHQITSNRDARGNTTTYSYDRLGNLTRMMMPNSRSTSFTYNGYLMTSMTRAEDIQDVTTHFEHDANGNVTIVRDNGRLIISQRTYDSAGNVLTSTDALGNTTTYTYDSMNRLSTQTDARGGVVQYDYDNMGNLTFITDERNHITSFEYDGMDRLVKVTDPRLFTEEFEYDANGNLIEKTDKNGDTIISQYDVLNRMENKTFPDESTYVFTYDPNNNLLTATDSDSDISFTYDERSDRLAQASTVNNKTVPDVDIFYSYDDNDNITSVYDSVAGADQIFYGYDESNRLIRIGRSSTDPSSIRFSYNKLDNRTGTIYPNGVTSSYLYTPGKPNRLRTLTHSLTTTPLNEDGTSGETTIETHSSFVYSYNLNDYVTGVDTVRSELTVNSHLTYIYDTDNQLTSATKPQGTGTETFTYDLSGNRLRRDEETVDSTFSDNNELTNDKTYTYVYDRNGNLTQRTHIATGQVTTYTWDYENQLTSVITKPNATAEPTSEVSYRYDALGRRIQKNVNDTITNYVYDRDNILLEFNAQNMMKAKYTHSGRTDEVMIMERPESPHTSESFSNQRYYYHHDRLGSTAEITNPSGDVVQRYVYDSFGNTSIYNKDGTEITEASTDYLKNPYTFTGRERDPETGLHYHRARYYNPEAGRWISSDPIGFDSGDTNFYRYVFNNSINFNDPDGEILCPIAIAAGVSYDILSAISNQIDKGEKLRKELEELRRKESTCSDPSEQLKYQKKQIELLRKYKNLGYIDAILATLPGRGFAIAVLICIGLL